MKLFSFPYKKSQVPVIFLDKDGVLNHDRPGKYVLKCKDLKIYRTAISGLKNIKNYKLIILTNQSAIGRGYITLDGFKKIANYMIKKFKDNGIKFDGFYFCPHKPSDNCFCRKPKTGLIKQVLNDFSVDLKKSFLVGDKKSDVIMAKKAGVKSILVMTGQAKNEIKKSKFKPDFTIKDLRGMRKILRNEK